VTDEQLMTNTLRTELYIYTYKREKEEDRERETDDVLLSIILSEQKNLSRRLKAMPM
jgi:hypothetical protein